MHYEMLQKILNNFHAEQQLERKLTTVKVIITT